MIIIVFLILIYVAYVVDEQGNDIQQLKEDIGKLKQENEKLKECSSVG